MNLTRGKIRSSDTAMVVWLGRPISEYDTLEVIEQTPLKSEEFKRNDRSSKVGQYQNLSPSGETE